MNDSIFVGVSLGENQCLHIANTHLLKTKKGIMNALEAIHKTQIYKDLMESGYNRTIKSEYQEWAAHNVLYQLGILKDRTGSADIDQNEPKWRRCVYAILSVFVR
jgi:hypothetical protein